MARVGTLAVVGGVFQIAGAAAIIGLATLLGLVFHIASSMGTPVGFGPIPLIGHALLVIGVIGAIVGIASIVIGLRLRGDAMNPKVGGAILIVLAIVSLFTCFAGGFIIGFILGLIDGVRALRS